MNEKELDYVLTIERFLDLVEQYGSERVYADMKLAYETRVQSQQGLIIVQP